MGRATTRYVLSELSLTAQCRRLLVTVELFLLLNGRGLHPLAQAPPDRSRLEGRATRAGLVKGLMLVAGLTCHVAAMMKSPPPREPNGATQVERVKSSALCGGMGSIGLFKNVFAGIFRLSDQPSRAWLLLHVCRLCLCRARQSTGVSRRGTIEHGGDGANGDSTCHNINLCMRCILWPVSHLLTNVHTRRRTPFLRLRASVLKIKKSLVIPCSSGKYF